MKTLADDANYRRLKKDVNAVKNDIATLTEQITEALNDYADAAQQQARRSYKQARANVDSAIDEASSRGSAMLDAAQDFEGSVEDAIAQRPLATVGLALGLGFLIGMAWRR